jgi:aldose 1-epimerase
VERVTVGGGDLEVEVLPELGARLHRLRAFGRDVLRTPEDPRTHATEPVFWGSYVMAPWCNRVEAGVPSRVGARSVELPPNFPDGSAIHGQVFTRPWEIEGGGAFAVRAGGDGWPWAYEVRQRIAASGGTLRLEHALTNASDAPMPGGLGIHPWFLRPLRLAINAERVHEANTAAAREPVPVSGPFDLRRIRDVPDDLDGCWTDVSDPPVELEWPAVGVRATMHAAVSISGPGRSEAVDGAGLLHVTMASPHDLDAVGVEPQTNAPQGLRRLLEGAPGGLVLLAPGQSLRLDVTLTFARI